MAVGRGGLDKGGGTNFCEARSKNRPGKLKRPLASPERAACFDVGKGGCRLQRRVRIVARKPV
jgi:hypothetical protein